jgi:chaperone required for assembly of F1-ATPase
VTKLDKPRQPPRFYKAVEVVPAGDRFGVALDGRPTKTPGGQALTAPCQALAWLMADEWAAQGETIDMAAMPATRLAFTALDHAEGSRAGMAEEVARYAGSDLLCYQAEEPRALAERETAAWGPWLIWADTALGVKLLPAIGISPMRQSPEALARVVALAEALDDFRLTGLTYAAGLYGSAVLAFAVERGALRGDEAYEVSRLDEAFQEEQWGIDDQARNRTQNLRLEAAMIARWFDTLSGA